MQMFSADLERKSGIYTPEESSQFSDLEVISLSLAAESIGIDSESFLFSKLNEYKDDFSSLISRRQYVAGSSLSAYVIRCVKELHQKLMVEKLFSVLILCQLKFVVP